jgi:hypothetical protein
MQYCVFCYFTHRVRQSGIISEIKIIHELDKKHLLLGHKN